MSEFLHLCGCLFIASTLTARSLAQEAVEPLEHGFNDAAEPEALPPPDSVEAIAVDTPTSEPETASATLRVLVDDNATVWINEHPTTTPQTSGGRRLFTLTELDSSTQYETIVKVRLQDGSTLQSEPFIVEAATHQEVAFPSIATGAAENAGAVITAGLVPSPMVGPIEQLQDESTWLAESTATLDDALGKLNTWKEKLDESVGELETSRKAVEAANTNFKTNLDLAQGKLDEATEQHLELATETLKTASTDLKTQLGRSTKNLTDSEKKLVRSTASAADKIEAMVERLEVLVNPFMDDGTPAAGPGANRIYNLKLEPEGETLRATLSYNEALEIDGIHFDASSLQDKITFEDKNEWNSPEVASGGVLKLGLRILFKNAREKEFIASEKYFETIQFESHNNRSAKIRFAQEARNNLKKWIEATVAENPNQTAKLVLDNQPTALILTGEFTTGFADAVTITKPLIIEILN